MIMGPVMAWWPALLVGGRLADLWWRHLLWAVQRCGLVATKLGQWAACRPDLFPREMCRRLEGLQAAAWQHSHEASVATLDVPAKIYGVVGSGVSAQVHRGSFEGRDVAVKITHPSLRSRLDDDLDALADLAATAEWLLPAVARWYDPSGAVRQFGATLRASASMTFEAAALRRLRNNGFVVPEVLAASENVLVETFEEGVPMASALRELRDRTARRNVARRGLRAILQMLFVDNFAHADMHASNLLLRAPPGRDLEDACVHDNFDLVLLDAGLVVELRKNDRRNFVELFAAIVSKDGAKAGRLLLDRAPDHANTDAAAFVDDVRVLVDAATNVHKLTLAQVRVAQLIADVLSLCYKHKVQLDSAFVNVCLAVAIVEGIGRQLDPDLDLLNEAAPYVARALLLLATDGAPPALPAL